MPISAVPFTSPSGANKISRPYLGVVITNPHTGLKFSTYGLIDTGADESALPAFIGEIIGHDLRKGTAKPIATGSGIAHSYRHTTLFKIFHPVTNELLLETPNTVVDYLPNLNTVLFGVDNFLSQFVLTVDYPNISFDLKFPIQK